MAALFAAISWALHSTCVQNRLRGVDDHRLAQIKLNAKGVCVRLRVLISAFIMMLLCSLGFRSNLLFDVFALSSFVLFLVYRIFAQIVALVSIEVEVRSEHRGTKQGGGVGNQPGSGVSRR